jgi:hypothetical protein
MAKKKSKLKKALLAGAALAGGLALAKNRRRASISGMDDAGIHVRHNAMKDFGPYTHAISDPTTVKSDFHLGFKKGGHVKSMGKAKRGGGVAIK